MRDPLAGSCRKDILRHAGAKQLARMATPMMRIHDAGQTEILLVALPKTSHPLLQQSPQTERAQVARVRDDLSTRYGVVPMQADAPAGLGNPQALCASAMISAAARWAAREHIERPV